MSNIEKKRAKFKEECKTNGFTTADFSNNYAEFEDYRNDFVDTFNNHKKIKLTKIGKEQMMKNAKTFFDEHYDIHDINYSSKKDFKKLCRTIYQDDTQEEVDEKYNNSIQKINPFEIPVHAILFDNYNGRVVANSINNINPMVFEKIYVGMKTNDVTTSKYIHEITHTQLQSNRGVIEDYFHNEVLSIFNELLYAFKTDKDLYDDLLIDRIGSTYDYIDEIFDRIKAKKHVYDYLEFVQYLVSTLKAFELLSIYVDDRNKRDYVISEVNAVLRGEQHLEELLNRFDISNDSISNPDNVSKLLI